MGIGRHYHCLNKLFENVGRVSNSPYILFNLTRKKLFFHQCISFSSYCNRPANFKIYHKNGVNCGN